MLRTLAAAALLLAGLGGCAGQTEQVVDGVTTGLETINRSSFRTGERFVCDLPRISVLLDELNNKRLVSWAEFCGYGPRLKAAFAPQEP